MSHPARIGQRSRKRVAAGAFPLRSHKIAVPMQERAGLVLAAQLPFLASVRALMLGFARSPVSHAYRLEPFHAA